jgi:integrase
MAIIRLTDTAVERLKPPATGRLEIADALMTGLILRVTPSGTKSWSLMYRIHGKQKRIMLGHYPIVSLKLAREKVKDAMLMVSEGIDPEAIKKSEIKEDQPEELARTVEELAKDFIERYAKVNTRTWKMTEQVFQNHIYPALGHRIARDVRRREVVAMLDKIAAMPRAYAANHVLSVLRKMYNWAIERDELEFNPCLNIKKPVAVIERERVLTRDEVKAFWYSADEFGYPYGAVFQILLLTGQRRSEIAELRWSQIDLEQRVIRLSRDDVKAKRGHDIPLSAPVIEILEKLPRFKGEYVFTTTHGKKPISCFGKMKRYFEESFDTEDWRIHDLRRTCATGLAELGVPVHTISRILNHAEGGVTKIYARYSYLPEKRRALELWASKVLEIVNAADKKDQTS